jgi:hypothetical protein
MGKKTVILRPDPISSSRVVLNMSEEET